MNLTIYILCSNAARFIDTFTRALFDQPILSMNCRSLTLAQSRET